MDRVTLVSHGMEIIKKYRYVFLIILVGIFLMTLPEKEVSKITSEESELSKSTEASLQESLAQILGLIEGAGKVEVLLTQAAGETVEYQTDEDSSVSEQSKDVHKDTVLISGSSREETGLIKQVNPPVYRGAIVLCQGADDPVIRLSIVEAVMDVTGLSSDKITVLKMK